MILAYFLEAKRLSSSDFAPVTTTLPEAKTRAVVFGSRIRIITAAKRCRRGERVSVQKVGERSGTRTYLGVVLCVTRVQGDRLEVETTVEVHRRHNVPSCTRKHDTTNTRTYTEHKRATKDNRGRESKTIVNTLVEPRKGDRRACCGERGRRREARQRQVSTYWSVGTIPCTPGITAFASLWVVAPAAAAAPVATPLPLPEASSTAPSVAAPLPLVVDLVGRERGAPAPDPLAVGVDLEEPGVGSTRPDIETG